MTTAKTSRKKASPAKPKQSKAASARQPRKTRCQDCGLTGRHAPSCRDAFKPSAETELPIEIVEGGRYWSVDDAELLVKRVAGETVHYTIDDGEMVFTEKRGRFREIVVKRIGEVEDAPAPGPREVKATVDGNDASIVIDGTTGKAFNAETAADPDAINDVLRRLAHANEVLLEKERTKKRASEDHKSAQTEQNNIVLELVRLGHAEPMLPGMSRAIGETVAARGKALADDSVALDEEAEGADEQDDEDAE